jgi:ubiquinone biosynthesis protein COQ9
MDEDALDWCDETERRVLDAAIGLAPELGWNTALLAGAAKAEDLSAGEAMLVFPTGARDLAALLSRRHDGAALRTLAALDPATLKVRDRIARGVLARLDAALADEAAVRRCTAFLALPTNLALAGRLLWASADVLWRWAGDTATDENHYSKRAILSAVLGSTLAVALNEDRVAAEAYLGRRIDDVMAFETWKAKWKPSPIARDLAGALGRLRYGRG